MQLDSEKADTDGGVISDYDELMDPTLPRKLLARRNPPVLQTDTGAGRELKVRGENLVKELGKLHP